MEFNVYNRQDYCGFWRRFLANSFDGIILGITYKVINMILLTIASQLGTAYPKFSEWVLCTIIFWAYMIWFKGYRGATPGYYILGIRIISINGAVVTIKQIVIRIISSLFSALALGMGYIWIAIDDNKQAWHDKIAGTYVIRSNANPVRTIETPRSGLIRIRLFASLGLVTLVLFIGFVGGVMYIITDEGGTALMIAAEKGQADTVSSKGTFREYYNKGLEYYKQGKYDQAGKEFENAIELKPNDVYAIYGLGNTYYCKAKYDDAVKIYTKAIKINPDYAKVHYSLSLAYNKLGMARDAEKEKEIFRKLTQGEKSVEETPSYGQGKFSQYYSKGIEYYKQGKYDQAGEEFKEALELKPNHVYALYGLGNTYYCKAKYDEAIKMYTKAIKINPDYQKVHYSLSLAYSKLGMARDAEKEKEIFRMLVRGADVDEKKRGLSALMLAAQEGQTETVKALLDGGAEVNTKKEDGWTALMSAARNGHTEIVKVLLATGADVNAKNKEGRTAVMLAATMGHTDTVKALLAGGADYEKSRVTH